MGAAVSTRGELRLCDGRHLWSGGGFGGMQHADASSEASGHVNVSIRKGKVVTLQRALGIQLPTLGKHTKVECRLHHCCHCVSSTWRRVTCSLI